MIKLFYMMFLLLILNACNKKSNYSPMLWEITGNNIKVSSYIFGTFHTRDSKINTLPSSVTALLKKSQRLYTEVPMSEKNIRQILVFSKMNHPIDLRQRLHPKTNKLLLKYLKLHKLPYTLQTLKPFKTWAISLILTNKLEESKYPNTLFMDERLITIAKKRNIKQSGLESPIEQLMYFDNLATSKQEQFLLATLTQSEDSAYNDALKSWYLRGEESGFLSIQQQFASQNPKQKKLNDIFIQNLLFKRNLRFSQRIDILLQNNSKIHYFFAIGAGHLSGEKGIPSHLRRLGYTLKKIN